MVRWLLPTNHIHQTRNINKYPKQEWNQNIYSIREGEIEHINHDIYIHPVVKSINYHIKTKHTIMKYNAYNAQSK